MPSPLTSDPLSPPSRVIFNSSCSLRAQPRYASAEDDEEEEGDKEEEGEEEEGMRM